MCICLKWLKGRLIPGTSSEAVEHLRHAETKIAFWKSRLRKEKRKLAANRLDSLSKLPLNLGDVSAIVDNKTMWTKFNSSVQSAREGKSLNEAQLKLAMGAVAVSILYRSWQRPGVVSNLTISEFDGAVKEDDTFCISVKNHKTGSLGPARLLADHQTMSRMRQYLKHIRPQLASPGNDIENFFILPNSKLIKKFTNLIKFMEKSLKIEIVTPTMVRKIGATAAVSSCDDATNKLISRQMSHHPTVGANYYEGIKGPHHAISAFKAMEDLRKSSSGK